MKKIVLFVLVALASNTFASSACVNKQVLAAKKLMAKNYWVTTKNISLVSFEPGVWTEMPAENTGTDVVTIALKRADADYAVEAYRVAAKQIGNTSDCKILNVKPM